jgi:hypothetical protein
MEETRVPGENYRAANTNMGIKPTTCKRFAWFSLPGENHWPVASHWQTWSHNVVSSTTPHEWGSNSTLVVIGTECTGSCKPNYHMIPTMKAPLVKGTDCIDRCKYVNMTTQTHPQWPL